MIDVVATVRKLVDLDVRVSVMSRNYSIEVPLVQNDTGPRLRFALKDDDGNAVPTVSGVGPSDVSLHLRRSGYSKTNVGHEACSGDDLAQGLWVYGLVSGDIEEPGTYFGDVEVTYDDGRVETAYEAVRFIVRESNR